jgi:hypothetical protein
MRSHAEPGNEEKLSSLLKDPSPGRHLSLDDLRLLLPVPNRVATTHVIEGSR